MIAAFDLFLKEFQWSKFSFLVALALTILLFAAISLSVYVKREKRLFTTAELAVSGVLTAMSFALSYIKIYVMPQGGSITLFSLAPLAVLCWYLGFSRSLIVCFAYSLLQMVQDSTLYHPIQILLDYLLPFSIFCILPLFKRFKLGGFIVGIIIASFIRYILHVLSGVVFFAEYAGDSSPLLYSMAYNSFVFIDIALAIVASIPLLLSRDVDKQFKRLIRQPAKYCQQSNW